MSVTKELLQSVDIFSSVSDEILEQVLNHLKPVQVSAGSKIVNEGDQAEEMYFLLEGTYTVVSEAQGKVAEDGPGSFFGEMGLIYNQSRACSVVADIDCVLASLSKSDFESLTEAHPEILEGIRTIAEERFNHFKEMLLNIGDPADFTDKQKAYFQKV
eukprot:TRINITY_DN1095_c0_g1_i2.p1 TRINITY_DN1095_c0_g1~~TRINITY_DN1095_c0_g1_i2.p1  ORF type:complete len:158 (+),score=37.11 TRINITY_DN1095_c0_g1_i2:49-522(+)